MLLKVYWNYYTACILISSSLGIIFANLMFRFNVINYIWLLDYYLTFMSIVFLTLSLNKNSFLESQASL